MSYPTLEATVAAKRESRVAARELRIRAIINKANALATNMNSSVAELEFMQALRAEFGDGQGFEAAWEDACHNAGWNDDAGDYTANLNADDRFDRSRRTDLAVAMGVVL